MPRLAVLLSGGGSNFQALLDNKLVGEIVLCISNRQQAYGLERARNHNIDSYVVRDNHKLLALLNDYQIDYILLAGYLKILPKEIINAYPKRILNIHPSLIPKYCGAGYYGEKVHQAVLDNKESETGVTIHLVDEGVDTGEILAQQKVQVKADDTVESLSQRVLEVEHSLYYQTVNDYIKKQEEEHENSFN